jgi:hypothetical protein
MYDEIFYALAAEGDILLPKPFPDLGFDGVVKWKAAPLEFHVFGKLKNISEGGIQPKGNRRSVG